MHWEIDKTKTEILAKTKTFRVRVLRLKILRPKCLKYKGRHPFQADKVFYGLTLGIFLNWSWQPWYLAQLGHSVTDGSRWRCDLIWSLGWTTDAIGSPMPMLLVVAEGALGTTMMPTMVPESQSMPVDGGWCSGH